MLKLTIIDDPCRSKQKRWVNMIERYFHYQIKSEESLIKEPAQEQNANSFFLASFWPRVSLVSPAFWNSVRNGPTSSYRIRSSSLHFH